MPLARSRVSRVELLVLVDDYSGFTELLSEHGLSVLVSVDYDDGLTYRVLLDAGSSGRVLVENSSKLGVDLSSVDAVVLSHRHRDHTGGLAALTERLRGKPLIAHPDVVRPCYAKRRGSMRFDVGLPPNARDSLRELETVLVREPVELAPGVWFLGEVERHYDNSYAVEGFKTTRDGVLVDEPMLDDTGVAIGVGDRALVVVGCAHSGVQNVARQARRLLGASEVAVLGGLHLAPASAQDVERVVGELREEAVVEVHAGHCTGLLGEAKLLEAYGDRMRRIHSGYRLELTAHGAGEGP